MNSLQNLSSFSNYGALVDLAAPGQSILSTMPGNQLCSISGTSMSAPFVSGVAALLFSANPALSAPQVHDIINQTTVSGRFGVKTGGKLNALNAIRALP